MDIGFDALEECDFGKEVALIMWILLPIVLAIWHVMNWLLVKGIIFVAKGLFNIDWANKFWVVYVGLIVSSMIIGGTISRRR